ncbi:glycerol-3-phosphate cytidylyltransferase [Priestia megaterium]|uniref:glycerol-3-phosphate cytidylyltransferase n=1 Tax=Priestia megaterium TaxID=1404 RepID=UPI00363E3ADC
MKKVITYGTFDLLHWGHINLLKRAKEMGDHLTVALSTDEFNQLKNKKSYYHYQHRKTILEAIRYVDLVVPETHWEQKKQDIEKYDIDIFVMGDDWQGKFDFLSPYCEVIYLHRTKNISTSIIKKDLKKV